MKRISCSWELCKNFPKVKEELSSSKLSDVKHSEFKLVSKRRRNPQHKGPTTFVRIDHEGHTSTGKNKFKVLGDFKDHEKENEDNS